MSAALARIDQIRAGMSRLTPPAAPPTGTPFAQLLTAAGPRSSPAGSASGTSPAASAAWNRASAPSALSSSARMTRDGVPVELAQYGNGKVPASALTRIGHGSHRLWAPAAEAFTRMEAAAARDGVDIGVTDSYRSYASQVDVARRKGLYSEGGLAAKPGTSDHGYGRSLDLDLDEEAQAWMRAHAGTYGFVEDTPREPWHWTFTPPRQA